MACLSAHNQYSERLFKNLFQEFLKLFPGRFISSCVIGNALYVLAISIWVGEGMHGSGISNKFHVYMSIFHFLFKCLYFRWRHMRIVRAMHYQYASFDIFCV